MEGDAADQEKAKRERCVCVCVCVCVCECMHPLSSAVGRVKLAPLDPVCKNQILTSVNAQVVSLYIGVGSKFEV